ncbi:BglG family transcription antiterminator [Halanaerobium salsuginis]|uniref:HTH domain-containing protein n=1 Tax=Halanaerobium salsuginis TaxID=29563 RepID=A0A1I4N2H9_9FIRM|nr:HTH domain-containing protein [Halanaerobium salsuginis]SFM09784.1 HTH domain-containing protein [Halanaerobium salsuginis]
MKISSRTKKIINILLNKDDYITINSIASWVGVSSRTIIRNLAEVENWLAENNYNLEKKKGTGIRLKISLQEKINVNKLLEGENINRHYLPEERKLIILTELLSSQIPAKLYTFTRLTNVSETTIAHDLDELEQWLKNYNLEIIRKPGLGVYLAGKERNIRKASIDLLYENFALEDILKIIQDRYLSQNRALIRKNIAKEKGSLTNVVKSK